MQVPVISLMPMDRYLHVFSEYVVEGSELTWQ